MHSKEVVVLKREERLIHAWIRDVTARKQGRLQEIRAKLRLLSGGKAGNTKVPKMAQAIKGKKVARKRA